MGYASGFQAGSAVAQRALDAYEQGRQRQLKERIGQEAARYDVTEGAYGPELQQNIDQLAPLAQQEQGLAREAAQQRARAEYEPSIAALQGRPEYAQNLEQVLRLQEEAGYRAANQGDLPVGPYGQAIQELQRRQGLTAPEYTIASRGPAFATRAEAEAAAKPMRTQGLANVYRQAGELEKADEAETRAMQMESAGLTLKGQRRTEATAAKVDEVDADVSKWLAKRLTGADGNMRAPEADDDIAALQYRATALSKAGLPAQATDVIKDYQSIAANKITLETAQRNSELGGVAAAIAQGDLGPAVAFYDRYVVDGAKVTGMKVDPKTGAITVSRVRDDGTELPATVIKGGANELLATLNSFKDPMSLYNFSQNEFANNLKLQELGLKKTELGIAVRKLNAAENEGGMTRQQKLAYDVLKGTDAFKAAVERGDQTKIRELLVSSGIPPEAYLGAAAAPPAGGTWAAPATPATAPAAPAPTKTTAPPRVGLSREQVGQTVTQQQQNVQAESRVRRAAIAEFEADPRVKQAYDAVRQLRRAGESARANNIEIQINARRDQFIRSRVGGQ